MYSSDEDPFNHYFPPSSDHQALALQEKLTSPSAKRFKHPSDHTESPKRARDSLYTPPSSPEQNNLLRLELHQLTAHNTALEARIRHLESKLATVSVDTTTNTRGLIQTLAQLQQLATFSRQLQQLPLSAMHGSLKVLETRVDTLEQNLIAHIQSFHREFIRIQQQLILINSNCRRIEGKVKKQPRTVTSDTSFSLEERTQTLPANNTQTSLPQLSPGEQEVFETIIAPYPDQIVASELSSQFPHQTCTPGSPSYSPSTSSLYPS